MQRRLQIAGHYGGQIDGIFGRQTRTGLVSWRNALQ
ncbi:peptidoglycan-binding protein [Sulfitobacter sp. CW3]